MEVTEYAEPPRNVVAQIVVVAAAEVIKAERPPVEESEEDKT